MGCAGVADQLDVTLEDLDISVMLSQQSVTRAVVHTLWHTHACIQRPTPALS